MMSKFTPLLLSRITANATSNKIDEPTASDSAEREQLSKDILMLARCKLLHSGDTESPRAKHTVEAQTAILDSRIMISYEPNREAAHKFQFDLVSSHMRTVFSVPQDREYLRSGYPSEPILAEAAARQMHTWRRSTEQESADPALLILMENMQNDILDRGEIGEVVGRMLLTLARDRASVRCHTSTGDSMPHFSKAVPLITFIEELFPEPIARELLDSRPDNEANGYMFRRSFESAVINFTHWAKWADDSASTTHAASACFIRSMAAICRRNAARVDALIPILIDKSKPLTPDNMTAILIQFKRRNRPSSRNSELVDEKEAGFFRGVEGSRPYIVFVIELGIVPSPSDLALTAAGINSLTARRLQKSREQAAERSSTNSEGQSTTSQADLKTPSKVHIPQCESEQYHRFAPPRYSIFMYGCSPTVYKVINDSEREKYKLLLRSGDLLSDHPRQDIDSLAAVRAQKPFFAIGHDAFYWIADELLNPMQD